LLYCRDDYKPQNNHQNIYNQGNKLSYLIQSSFYFYLFLFFFNSEGAGFEPAAPSGIDAQPSPIGAICVYGPHPYLSTIGHSVTKQNTVCYKLFIFIRKI
jgi:hypothetical protein